MSNTLTRPFQPALRITPQKHTKRGLRATDHSGCGSLCSTQGGTRGKGPGGGQIVLDEHADALRKPHLPICPNDVFSASRRDTRDVLVRTLGVRARGCGCRLLFPSFHSSSPSPSSSLSPSSSSSSTSSAGIGSATAAAADGDAALCLLSFKTS